MHKQPQVIVSELPPSEKTAALIPIFQAGKQLSSPASDAEIVKRRFLDFMTILFQSLQGVSMDFRHKMMLQSAQGILLPAMATIESVSLQWWLERSSEILPTVLKTDCSEAEYEAVMEPFIRQMQDALINGQNRS